MMQEPIVTLPSSTGDPAPRIAASGTSFSVKEWRGSGPATLR